MKKLAVVLLAAAFALPTFAQAPAQTDQPKAEKTKKKPGKKSSKKKAEQPNSTAIAATQGAARSRKSGIAFSPGQ